MTYTNSVNRNCYMMPVLHSYHLIYKMKVLVCASLLFLLLNNECHGAPYQPGDKGGRWTDDQAEIIRDKLLYLWANSNRYINRTCYMMSV